MSYSESQEAVIKKGQEAMGPRVHDFGIKSRYFVLGRCTAADDRRGVTIRHTNMFSIDDRFPHPQEKLLYREKDIFGSNLRVSLQKGDYVTLHAEIYHAGYTVQHPDLLKVTPEDARVIDELIEI